MQQNSELSYLIYICYNSTWELLVLIQHYYFAYEKKNVQNHLIIIQNI